jgi:hypothetical protein
MVPRQKSELARSDSILITGSFASRGSGEGGVQDALFCADFVSSHHRAIVLMILMKYQKQSGSQGLLPVRAKAVKFGLSDR